MKKTVTKNKRVAAKKVVRMKRAEKFSPAWVLDNSKDAPGFHFEVIERIKSGVKKDEWKGFIQQINTTEKEFEHVLPVSPSSMQKKNKYGPETSERIYELAQLFNLGYEVFDSKDDFKLWLETPSKALGNNIPFQLLDSSYGFRIVSDSINRIKYNVYS